MKQQSPSLNWQATLRGTMLVTASLFIQGFFTSPSFGQNPLFVHTQPANAIRTNRATLNGMVLPGSNPAVAWFEWGTSKNYGKVAGLTNLTATNNVITLSRPLNGLSPDYVYHFRIVASNAVGLFVGADEQFILGGSVFVWGNPGYGQIPAPADLTNAVAIGAGGEHCLALKNDGTVAAWGDNYFGQTDVPLDLSNVVAIAAGQFHNLALTADGKVRAWGAGTIDLYNVRPYFGQSIVPLELSNVVAIAAGTLHSLALRADGSVVAWGAGMVSAGFAPQVGQAIVPSSVSNVVAVAGGDVHSVALKADGRLVAWGAGTYVAVPEGSVLI